MVINRVPDRNCYVGVDLQKDGCQISYLRTSAPVSGGSPRTFSRVAGKEEYLLPMDPEEGPLCGEAFAVYLKKCFSLLSADVPAEGICAVCFTARSMDAALAGALRDAARAAVPGDVRILCEDHGQSFYSYMLVREEEQKKHGVMLLDGWGDDVRLRRMRISRRTRPAVCMMGKEEVLMAGPFARDQEADAGLSQILSARLREEPASAVYLTGPLFAGGWMQDSLRTAARGRRAFRGDNLYSTGAVYSALRDAGLIRNAGRYCCFGPDTLRSNIGILCRRKYAPVCLPLLEAGTEPDRAFAEEEFIMDDSGVLTLTQTDVTTGETQDTEVHLEPFPDRPEGTVRIRLTLSMPDSGTLHIAVQDLGFGEIFASSGMRWEQVIRL